MNLPLCIRADFRFLAPILFVVVLFSCDNDDPAPAPEVLTIDPSSAYPNTIIAIKGKSFSPVFSENKVSFNGTDALVTNASSTQLNVVVPAGAASGPVTIIVNGNTASNKPTFTVIPLPTVITGISPLSGRYNTIVMITGSNFYSDAAANTVTFNGVRGVVESATATNLTVRVPARAGTGPVTVNGVAATNQFVYTPDVYIGGYIIDGAGNSLATYWKNGVPNIISPAGSSAYVLDLAVEGDDIYLAGYRIVGAYSVACMWKNGVETLLATAVRNSNATGITVEGNDVYVAGIEYVPGGIKAVYWKNGTQIDLTDGKSSAYTSAIVAHGQDVYVSGNSTLPDGTTVATYWKNGTPTTLTTGVSFAWDIFVTGDDVYTAGSIRSTGPGSGYVCYWKNKTSVLLSPGLGSGRGSEIAVTGNTVHVAGWENNVKFESIVKHWTNGEPAILNDNSPSAFATGLDVLGDDVYALGQVFNAAGVRIVKMWKNGVPFSITDGGYHSYGEAIVVR